MAAIETYGVVVCPHCHWPKGLALSTRTSRCPRCNRSLEVGRLKVFARVADARSLPEAVGRVADTMKGELPLDLKEAIIMDHRRPVARRLKTTAGEDQKGPRSASTGKGRQSRLDPLTLALRAATLSGAHSRWERVTAAVREQGKLQEDFDELELCRLLQRLGVVNHDPEDPDDPASQEEAAKATARWLGRLEEAGIVYSPVPGRYRLV